MYAQKLISVSKPHMSMMPRNRMAQLAPMNEKCLEKFEKLRKYHVVLNTLLKKDVILAEKCFEKLQESLNDFIELYSTSNSGLLGTNREIKHVNSLIINNLTDILSIANPPNRNQMETVALALNHIINFFLAQTYPTVPEVEIIQPEEVKQVIKQKGYLDSFKEQIKRKWIQIKGVIDNAQS